MKISVVLAYHNRKHLLFNTLKSIVASNFKSDVEFIIVDDGSDPQHSIEDFVAMFIMLDIKLITIKKEDKWWINPCIPLNIGFKEAVGDVIIIQNPECLHTGNVIDHVASNIRDNMYIAMGCYAIDHMRTSKISMLELDYNYYDRIKDILKPYANMPCGKAPTPNKWYQHSVYRPAAFNFCTAILKDDLDDLGGFDERFGRGIAKDDKEFVLRINRKGMDIEHVDEPFVVHQYHAPVSYTPHLVAKNTVLWEEWQNREGYKVNNKFEGVKYERKNK